MFTACPKSWLQDFWKDVCVCMGVCMYVYKYVCVCVCVYISPVVRNGLIGSWYPETNRSYFLKESLFSLFDSVLPVGNSELTKTPFSNPCSQYVLAILSTSFFFWHDFIQDKFDFHHLLWETEDLSKLNTLRSLPSYCCFSSFSPLPP